LTDCNLVTEHFADNQFADRSYAVILSSPRQNDQSANCLVNEVT